ncbi:MAG TPA: DUF2961 domain-containing protein [Candidatus Bathyarchaeia archaeon]|nr:DUF2961 domain-containing protein [Candidatus Bathyarchaeia archaeon]
MKRFFVQFPMVLVLALSGAGVAAPITTGSLVDEMVDLRGLTYLPDPKYETVQFSSYDRRSTVPGGPLWFSNSDGFGGEPIPNFEAVLKEPGEDKIGEYLVCDVEGPGAIVRVWTAKMEGALRVLLDGEKVFDGLAQEFLTKPYDGFAKTAGVDSSIFAGTFYQRDAAYCPMPFAGRCRIEWSGDLRKLHFYQIQVRLYDKSAQVITFQAQDLKACESSLQRAAKVLADPDGAYEFGSTSAAAPFELTVGPGEKKQAIEFEGPKAIERLRVAVSAGDRDLALRQTVVHVECDAYPWGQVQAPVGDFFGTAPGVNPYVSLPFTVAADGASGDGTMTSRYVMPFERSLRLVFENLGEQPVTIKGDALADDYAWDAARSMHFRARWRVDHGLVASNKEVQDLPFVVANGAGVYVGTAIMMLNPNEIPTPHGNWWGEGDEKVFVDGEARPSTFGTGSEDYFNYSWSAPDIFFYPYCGQPRNDGPANRGFVSNHRWQIVDALPFKERIAFYMELFSHERTPGYSYARIGYHYGRPGLTDDHVTITKEDVRRLELPANWQPQARFGAARSVFYQAEELVKGRGLVKMEKGNLWSGGEIARWQPKKAGDTLTLAVPVEKAGKYGITLVMAHEPGGAKVSAQVDGKAAGFGGKEGVVNIEEPYRVMLLPSGTQTIELTEGKHEVVLKVEESGKQAVGIDFVWVQRRR